MARPWLRFHTPLIGRVGDWRAGLGRSLCSLLARSFVGECHTISAVPRFQPPPRRTQHADFPHCALLFASPQGLWGPLSLRLDVYSPPQVLQIDGRLCHLVLAFLVVGDFTNSRAPSLHGRYPASTLLRTHPSPSRLRSTSRLSRLYDRPAPAISRRDEEGFSSCSACPCHRAVASTPPK